MSHCMHALHGGGYALHILDRVVMVVGIGEHRVCIIELAESVKVWLCTIPFLLEFMGVGLTLVRRYCC